MKLLISYVAPVLLLAVFMFFGLRIHFENVGNRSQILTNNALTLDNVRTINRLSEQVQYSADQITIIQDDLKNVKSDVETIKKTSGHN